MLGRGQRRRARHEQARLAERRRQRRLPLGRVSKASVHRRDAEHHRRAAAQRVPDRVGREPADVHGRPAATDRAEDPDHEPVDVEQRQPVGDGVALGPCPGVRERVEVRGDRAPRQDRALGRPGSPRRVDDQGRILVGVAARAAARRRAVIEVDGHDLAVRERVRSGGAGRQQQPLGRRVGRDVRQLARARPRVDRYQRDAGQQGADHRHARLRAGVGEHRGAAGADQRAGDPQRRVA